MDLVFVLVVGLAVGAAVVWALPHFLRGFRDARDRRGVDLNMEHRVEQELAEEQAGNDEWRQRIDEDLDEQVERWRRDAGTDQGEPR